VTPAVIVALVKDVVILIAVGLALYFVVNYGKDLVKVADMKAVQRQLDANSQTEAQWRREEIDANARRDEALARVSSTIGGQHAPVYIVRGGPPRSGTVSGTPGATSGAACPRGGTDDGPRVDSRPAVNSFELKYETALAECYAALDKWPQAKP